MVLTTKQITPFIIMTSFQVSLPQQSVHITNNIPTNQHSSTTIFEMKNDSETTVAINHITQNLESIMTSLNSPSLSNIMKLSLIDQLKEISPTSSIIINVRQYEKNRRQISLSSDDTRLPSRPTINFHSSLVSPPQPSVYTPVRFKSSHEKPFSSCLVRRHTLPTISNDQCTSSLLPLPTLGHVHWPIHLVLLWFRALHGFLKSYDVTIITSACQIATELFDSSLDPNGSHSQILFNRFLQSAIETRVIYRIIEILGHPHADTRQTALYTMMTIFAGLVCFIISGFLLYQELLVSSFIVRYISPILL